QIFSSGTVPYNMPPGMILNSAFHSQPINYAAMGNFLAHQQYLAAMSNFQHLSNPNAQNASTNHAAGVNVDGY
ncbi:hypothetical protein, partial [Shigella flexneri]|uniref:hypothetical protein n=1 Tax=Shigella flexneri TaxID=623 RepID=UPI001C0A71C0